VLSVNKIIMHINGILEIMDSYLLPLVLLVNPARLFKLVTSLVCVRMVRGSILDHAMD
jgi:hypothetical protein